MLLKIDQEFKNLIRPLTFDERKGLKENLIENGCLDSIKIWNDIIVDGHNRYEICTENDIEFRTDELSFDDKDEVKIWMIRQQLDKRNINDYVRTSLCLKMEGIFQAKAEQNKKVASRQSIETLNQVSTNLTKPELNNVSIVPEKKQIEPVDTRKEVAKIANVSEGTVSKVKFIEENATDDQKDDLINDKTSIHKVYTEIKKQEAPEEEIEKEDYVDTDYCSYTPFIPLKSQVTICPCGCGYGYCETNEKWYNPEQIAELDGE